MVAQEGAKRGRPDVEETEMALAMAQSSATREMSLEELGLPDYVGHLLSNAGLRTAQDILDMLARGEDEILSIPRVGGKTVEKVRRQLAEKGLLEIDDKETDAEQKRQGQAKDKPARTEIKGTPMEVEKAKEARADNRESRPTSSDDQRAERPFSFVVRLTVDERGQPLRTHIQPAKSEEKGQTFLGLDVQGLATYMKDYIDPFLTQEPTIPPARPPKATGTPRPKSIEPTVHLTISDVAVFPTRSPGTVAFVLSPDETFVIQARFQLKGPEACSIAAKKSSFEIQVYAYGVPSGTSRLLATYAGNLIEDLLQYSAHMQAARLPPGLYYLITVVTFHAPVKVGGHHKGPIVRVADVQLLGSSTAVATRGRAQ
jgi:hypothetical protein